MGIFELEKYKVMKILIILVLIYMIQIIIHILNELSKKDYDILFVNNIEKYMITHLCKNS